MWRSSLKRSRDFGPIFDPIGPFLPHPGRDGFGTETLASQCEGGKSCKERRETKKAERVTLGGFALTPWWTGLQAKTKSSSGRIRTYDWGVNTFIQDDFQKKCDFKKIFFVYCHFVTFADAKGTVLRFMINHSISKHSLKLTRKPVKRRTISPLNKTKKSVIIYGIKLDFRFFRLPHTRSTNF